jgi:hypothetical protein
MSTKRKATYFILIAGFTALASVYIFPHLTAGALASSYRTSWFGNTFGGGKKWVQNNIEGMYVSPDGTVYTNSEWDEAGKESGIYRDGDVVGGAEETHGEIRLGGAAVTANSKYMYMAMAQGEAPPKQTIWNCVRRYTLSGKSAPFSGGRGYDKSMLVISTSPKHMPSDQVTGLATAGSELYVSDSKANRIRVYDPEKMTELRSWPFARPQNIAVDRTGNLWIIQNKDGSNSPKILSYSKTGKLLSGKIIDVVEPTALAVDNQGRLLVAENGPRQQVLIYDIKDTPKLAGTFGQAGGIYSGKRGEIGALKFYGITGIGADAKGNLYVNSSGFGPFRSGTDLRKLSASGTLQWRLLGLEFTDNADADPATDGANVFTRHEHFVMDYSKGSGKEWTYQGFTLDKFRYPDDPRLHNYYTSAFVRRIEGKRFLYLNSMFPSHFAIFRFDGEIAVPCAIFAQERIGSEPGEPTWPPNQPSVGSWTWRDRNGDGSIQNNEYEILNPEDNRGWGWEVDSKGDIWQAIESGKIIHHRQQGLDNHGIPVYTRNASEIVPAPEPFTNLTRIKYFPETDVMYLGGYTTERPKTGEEWGIVGTEIIRYDNWSTKRKLRWRTALPYAPSADPKLMIKVMDVAGDRVFAGDVTKAEVYVYDAKRGTLLTKLAPGPEVAKQSGWIDTPYGLRAFKRENGEYILFVEEDLYGKIILYRMAS